MKAPIFFTTYLFLMYFMPAPAECQESFEDDRGALREVSLDANIRTIQLYREGWAQSYPVMRLKGDVPLVLEFDDLSDEGDRYYYRFIHCNADWSPSELLEMDYLEGYAENEVDGGRPSFNTYTSFMHYRLSLPNENVRLLASGNYLLVVYRNMDPGDVVFTRRLLVTESAVNIEARAGRPLRQHYQGCCQEISFTVGHRGLNINDPWSECTAMVLQNGVWDMALGPLKPFTANPGEILFESHEEYIFPGGNEFRFFDTKNTHTPTYYVRRIEFVHPWHHFELKASHPNPSHVYLSGEDVNGRYHIDGDRVGDPSVEADYVVVHFRLDMPEPLLGEVFLAGAMTNWQFGDMSRMNWDSEEGAYRQSLMLKQGVYNYRYLFLPEGSEQFSLDEIEGSFFETENEYLILFYHRPPGERYDRLVGHQVVHSN